MGFEAYDMKMNQFPDTNKHFVYSVYRIEHSLEGRRRIESQ